ncbi:HEAT repeat domain-containing protein [Phytomonospora endophytica]|uniref:HEAT repeat domain-containing protein n=1 Tax=Phytomonospora endophytica TaxID=714109 RepID=A0A841F8T1_9ACTN|nr:HEAT repeat domain-containing protein [Phytomonospora endophytica]MBB6033511.1 hypothetical protein [Phytomonospora endophytica]GIG64972.1 hypothetical protein Pen01_12670 [Phytomonospora endophytica]
MPRPEPPDPAAHPRDLLAGAALHYGEAVVATWCGDLLTGRVEGDDEEHPPLAWLGGRVAAWELGRTAPDGEDHYWPRVWGARGLLYVWIPEAAAAVVAGLDDPAWRVREMSAKLVRLREIGEAAELLADLTGEDREPVPRVRAAAARALGAVGEGEHAPALRAAEHDGEAAVRVAAEQGLRELRGRLDRDL